MADFKAGGPGGADGRPADGDGRPSRLAGFAQHRYGDTAPPNAWHVMILNELTGADDRCPDATDDEALGLMGRWKAAESWAAARTLGVAREMIRRRAVPEKGMATGTLPWEWEPDLGHEVAAQLRISLTAAHKLLHVAWALEARLPGVGRALADGRLEPGQARMIVTETGALPGDKAAAAEEMILAGLGECKSWADLLRLVQRAVVTADPDGARRRREEAERESARVRLWRESSGACALAGHALPADEALAAYGQVEARAQHYRQQGIREYIDLLRVLAYLDILNGVPAEDRVARWTAEAAAKEAAGAGETAQATRGRARPGPRETGSRNGAPPGDAGHEAPSDAGESGSPGAAGEPGAGGPELRARVNLTIPMGTAAGPMGTAAGHADQPGEAWELGVLDPALARQLLAAAARSRDSQFCVTVTDQHGYAVGHGCAKPARQATPAKPARQAAPAKPARAARQAAPASPGKPGRHGTATASAKRTGPPSQDSALPRNRATFTRREGPGPPGGLGSWALTLPGTATILTVDIRPVPTHDCDHAYESAGHDPSDWLRHVVQVRDGKCSFPSCGRHARESEFEHAQPFDKGGLTCACNCHACSRSCHQVKQRPGWNVTSPRPGWHQWTAPSGRSYVQGPWRYPA